MRTGRDRLGVIRHIGSACLGVHCVIGDHLSPAINMRWLNVVTFALDTVMPSLPSGRMSISEGIDIAISSFETDLAA